MSSMDPIRHCYILLLLILATLVTSPALSHMINGPSSPSIRERYQQWLSEYRRGYKDTTEQEQRFNVFKTNVEFIDAFNNASGGSYRLSVNEFADLTNEEFIKHRNGFKSSYSDTTPVTQKSFMHENATNLPASIDWREKGAMTPVEDQGQCGITQIRTGKLVGLSVQEIVDCDKNTVNQGCNGGLMSSAFEYIQQNGGLTTQTNYPYKGADGSCNLTQAANHATQIEGFEKVPPSEDELLKAVANQPVSVAIDGSGKDFQFYSCGIFDGECGNVLTHGVAIVGYGTSEKGTKYWLVKNSWGKGWGEEGYLRLKRGQDGKEGLCGIAKEASYPHEPNYKRGYKAVFTINAK